MDLARTSGARSGALRAPFWRCPCGCQPFCSAPGFAADAWMRGRSTAAVAGVRCGGQHHAAEKEVRALQLLRAGRRALSSRHHYSRVPRKAPAPNRPLVCSYSGLAN